MCMLVTRMHKGVTDRQECKNCRGRRGKGRKPGVTEDERKGTGRD
jgi:hypothetical protein